MFVYVLEFYVLSLISQNNNTPGTNAFIIAYSFNKHRNYEKTNQRRHQSGNV